MLLDFDFGAMLLREGESVMSFQEDGGVMLLGIDSGVAKPS
jgi:hypothetical protein